MNGFLQMAQLVSVMVKVLFFYFHFGYGALLGAVKLRVFFCFIYLKLVAEYAALDVVVLVFGFYNRVVDWHL